MTIKSRRRGDPPARAPVSQSKSISTRRRRKGQALTEYATLIAFVSVLVALAFSFTTGKIGPAISQAYHTTAEQLNHLTETASNPPQ